MQISNSMVLAKLLGFLEKSYYDVSLSPLAKVASGEKVLGPMPLEAKQVWVEICELKAKEHRYSLPARSRKLFAQSDLARNFLLKELRHRLKFLNTYFLYVIYSRYKLWGTNREVGYRENWLVVTFDPPRQNKVWKAIQDVFN